MISRSNPILTLLPKSRPKLIHEQTRTAFYNKYRHGPQKITNPDTNMLKWWKSELTDPKGRRRLSDEIMYMLKWPFKVEFLSRPEFDKTYIFEHFDSDESIKRWKPVADRDGLNGFSTSHISRSPNGHFLFHGLIDNSLPDDGLTANAGFAAVIGPQARRRHVFEAEAFWDWSRYNCIEIKFRGDGRKYAIVLSLGSYFDDLGYYDNYAYPLYTRGGPYWQTMRIPFSKFIFNYKSFIQDRQSYLPAHRIAFVAFAIHDKIDGPFALEIDYLGLRFQQTPFWEITPYEKYRIKHIRFRPIQVESPPPQVD